MSFSCRAQFFTSRNSFPVAIPNTQYRATWIPTPPEPEENLVYLDTYGYNGMLFFSVLSKNVYLKLGLEWRILVPKTLS